MLCLNTDSENKNLMFQICEVGTTTSCWTFSGLTVMDSCFVFIDSSAPLSQSGQHSTFEVRRPYKISRSAQ